MEVMDHTEVYYSTEQFSAGVLWSLEGQWQFRVGKELAVAVQLEPDELFRWPKNNEIVQITGKSICEDPAGCFNYNNLAQTFAAICGHVICTNTDHLCANPIRPHGHCCPICGGVINLHENGINFSWLKEKIMRLQTDTGFRTSNFQMGLTLQRIDRDTPMPSYQIAVIPLSPRGGHADVYDEDLIEQFIEEVIADITIIDSAINLFHIQSEYSYQRGKFHAGYAFLVFILVLLLVLSIVGGVYVYRVNRFNP
uniref:Protein amnionless n=1 Tax=Plectus sambesii TaxID=2011161 RepID=A0A914WEV8_9BILA